MIGTLAFTLTLPILLWFVTAGPSLASKPAGGTFSAALALVLVGFAILLAWRALAATYAVDTGDSSGMIVAIALVSFSVSYGIGLVVDARASAGWTMTVIGALGGAAYVALEWWGSGRRQASAQDNTRRKTEEAAARARKAADEEAGRWHRTREDEQTKSRSGHRPWWDILGVSPHASVEEINQRYRQLVMQYHPDRVAGLGPELIEVAERQTRLINAALAQAREARGHVAGGVA